jgi:hypothetical protein
MCWEAKNGWVYKMPLGSVASIAQIQGLEQVHLLILLLKTSRFHCVSGMMGRAEQAGQWILCQVENGELIDKIFRKPSQVSLLELIISCHGSLFKRNPSNSQFLGNCETG